MPALTLASAVAQVAREDTYKAGLIGLMAEANPLVANLPLVNIGGNGLSYSVETAQPGIATRALYADYATTAQTVEKRNAVLQIMGGKIEVDRAILHMHGQQIAANQEISQARALGNKLANAFINGDPSIPAFTSLRDLVVPATGLIPAGTTPAGDPLSLLTLQKAIDATRGANVIVMSKRQLARMTYSGAAQNAVTSALDQFGVPRLTFNGLPIFALGQNEMGGDLLPYTETTPGGGATGSSVYVLDMSETGFHGIQNALPRVFRTSAGDTSAPVYSTEIEWIMNLVALHNRAVTRIWGIADAPVISG